MAFLPVFFHIEVAPTPSVLEAVRLMKAGDYPGCRCRCHSSSWSLEVPGRGTSQPRVVRKGSKGPWKGPWKTWRILGFWKGGPENSLESSVKQTKSSGPVALGQSFRRGKFQPCSTMGVVGVVGVVNMWGPCGAESPSKLHRPAISTSSFSNFRWRRWSPEVEKKGNCNGWVVSRVWNKLLGTHPFREIINDNDHFPGKCHR